MARHNEVTMFGQVTESPTILYNSSDETNENRSPVRTIGTLAVLRGIRDFGALDKRIRMDLPTVLTLNPKMMTAMCDWEVGDLILLRGTVATANVTKPVACPHCGHVENYQRVLAYVNPIYMRTEGKGYNSDQGMAELRRNSEISNRVTIIGRACGDPEIHVTERNQTITNYQMDVARKYRVREDDPSNRHDFPFVKSYGAIAENDAKHIKEGALVFVDGAIQTRDYTKTVECANCHKEYTFINTATEIIPYSTEYLRGCRDEEEIMAEEKKEAESFLAGSKSIFEGE